MKASGKKNKGRKILLVVIALFAFIGVLAMTLADLAIRHESLIGEAMAIARTSPIGKAQLGNNIRTSWPIRGTYSFSDVTGHAEIMIPVVGSHGPARLYVNAVKEAENWRITSETLSKYPQGQWTLKQETND